MLRTFTRLTRSSPALLRWGRFCSTTPKKPLSTTETVKVTINGAKTVTVPKGSTLLDACRKAKEFVPTMCHHPMLEPVGLCRLCLVELVNENLPSDLPNKLVASCAIEAQDGMKIITQSERLTEAVKTNLKLLRCRHPNQCMTCHANGRCQFQSLVYRYQVEEAFPQIPKEMEDDKEMRAAGEQAQHDRSSHALNRDMEKCISCTRCIRACSDVQGMHVYGMTERGFNEQVITIGDLPIAETQCMSCGQCTAVCPVGALTEKPHLHDVQSLLHNKKGKILVASTAPAVRVAIGEEFYMQPGSVSTGKMVSSLRELGFDYVFDTNYSADLTIAEEALEFARRLKAGGPFPLFTSCCPGWINLCEKVYPTVAPHMSTCKSPQGMIGAVIKRFFAEKLKRKPSDIIHVSIMPCVAKKDEIKRPQLTVEEKDAQGNVIRVPETDYVLTTRELGQLLKNEKVPFASLGESNYDTLLGDSTGAAQLFAVTGGVMEAALRGAYEYVTGQALEEVDFHAVRGLDSKTGGIREAVIPVAGTKLNVAIAHGTKNIRNIVEQVLKGGSKYNNFHLIEIMACPGGCIGGGGQSKSLDPEILQKRAQSVYEIDAKKAIRRPLKNPMVEELYSAYLGEPGSHKAHDVLHTHYTDRTTTVKYRADKPFGNIPTTPSPKAV